LKITGNYKSYQITLGVIECVDLLKTYPELRKGSPPLKPHPVENAMEERSSITTTSEHHPRQEKGKLLVTYNHMLHSGNAFKDTSCHPSFL